MTPWRTQSFVQNFRQYNFMQQKLFYSALSLINLTVYLNWLLNPRTTSDNKTGWRDQWVGSTRVTFSFTLVAVQLVCDVSGKSTQSILNPRGRWLVFEWSKAMTFNPKIDEVDGFLLILLVLSSLKRWCASSSLSLSRSTQGCRLQLTVGDEFCTRVLHVAR